MHTISISTSSLHTIANTPSSSQSPSPTSPRNGIGPALVSDGMHPTTQGVNTNLWRRIATLMIPSCLDSCFAFDRNGHDYTLVPSNASSRRNSVNSIQSDRSTQIRLIPFHIEGNGALPLVPMQHPAATVQQQENAPRRPSILSTLPAELIDGIVSYLSDDSKSLSSLAKTNKDLYHKVIPSAAIARLNENVANGLRGQGALRIFNQLAKYPAQSTHQVRLVEKFYAGATAAANTLYDLPDDGKQVSRFKTFLDLTKGFTTPHGIRIVPTDRQKASLLERLVMSTIVSLPPDRHLDAITAILRQSATLPAEHRETVLLALTAEVENLSDIHSPDLLRVVNEIFDASDRLPSKHQGRILAKMTEQIIDLPPNDHGFQSISAQDPITSVTGRHDALLKISRQVQTLDIADKPAVVAGLASALQIYDGCYDNDATDAQFHFNAVMALNNGLRAHDQGPGLEHLATCFDYVGESHLHTFIAFQSILTASDALTQDVGHPVRITLAKNVHNLWEPAYIATAKEMLLGRGVDPSLQT